MPSSLLARRAHHLFSKYAAPLLDRAYNALKPAMVPNWLMPPDVVTLTAEKWAPYRDAMRQINQLRRKQSPDSKLRVFWDSFSERPYIPSSSAASSGVQSETATRTLEEHLAEQFFNTPEPDYALGSGETLVVQFKPESVAKYHMLLEGLATVEPVAEGHHVYRLSNIRLTKQGLAELKQAATFTLLVDDHIKTRYNTSTDVVHFDTGLRAAFGRALARLGGGRKTTKDDYVVQPQNGSTQKLLDAVQKYELPVHAVDLHNGIFVFDGRYRLPPALLNSSADQNVIPTAVYGPGIPVYDIARRVNEAKNTPPASQN